MKKLKELDINIQDIHGEMLRRLDLEIKRLIKEVRKGKLNENDVKSLIECFNTLFLLKQNNIKNK